MKKPPIVEVCWNDSIDYSLWTSIDEKIEAMEEPEAMEHMTSGYLIKKTKKYIAVTHSFGKRSSAVLSTIQIPCDAIISFRVVEK